MKKLTQIPTAPGIYKFLDQEKNIIYIGKAKNLKKRVSSYFQKNTKSIRIQKLVENIKDIKWIETETELAALLLENNLIKEYQPKYNIALRDDKNFAYIKITTNEDFPRIRVVRKLEKDGNKYFGPILAAHKIEKTFKILRKVLPFRTCNLDLKPGDSKKPCLDHYIKRCLSPCIGECTPQEYKKVIDQVINFLEGKPEEILKKVKQEMQLAAETKKFELAASLRDKFTLISEISQKQVISDPKMANTDALNFHREGKYIYVNLFQIRNGKLINQENFTLKSAEVEDDPKEILDTFIKNYYDKAVNIPKTVLIPFATDPILKTHFKTSFTVPQKGDKKHLLDLALKNAVSYAKQSRIKVMQEELDPLEDLQKLLKLAQRPSRIECYDISHLAGTNQVGSMVVFENGLAKNKDYRRFRLRMSKESDDYGSIAEVLKRRLGYLAEIKDKYEIKRALKKDMEFIKTIQPNGREMEYKQFYMVKKGKKSCGFIRERLYGQTHILASLWVSEKERGAKLGHRLIRHALSKSKAKRLYIVCRKELSHYYEQIGFQKVKKVPKDLEHEKNYCEEKFCSLGSGSEVFVYDKKKFHDASFAAKPDLIVIDGGKGQLKVGEKALKLFGLKIPVISIAKKNEEIHFGRRKIVLERTAEALKLVQRIRDEAHRFALEYQRKLRKLG